MASLDELEEMLSSGEQVDVSDIPDSQEFPVNEDDALVQALSLLGEAQLVLEFYANVAVGTRLTAKGQADMLELTEAIDDFIDAADQLMEEAEEEEDVDTPVLPTD